jgi:hypothetical protein
MYEIYCDGSPTMLCAVINDEPYLKDLYLEKLPTIVGVEKMEYAAIIFALTILPDGASGKVYCDNQTVVSRLNSDEVDQAKEPDLFIIKNIIKDKRFTLQVKWIPRKKNKAGTILR